MQTKTEREMTKLIAIRTFANVPAKSLTPSNFIKQDSSTEY